MICVLRIGGITMNTAVVRQALSLKSYRIDVRGTDGAKVNCLYYDVINENGLSSKGGASKINEFLSAHSAELTSMACLEGVEFRNLDVGLMLHEGKASVLFELEEALIRKLSELHISVSISTYLASSSS